MNLLYLVAFWTSFGPLALALQQRSHEESQSHVVQLKATSEYNSAGRRIIALNGYQESFGPTLRVRAGDSIQLSLENQICSAEEAQKDADDNALLGYCSTGLHFHGLIPIGNDVDGVPGLTQKAIQRGETYWYNFTIPEDVCGTFWYHSHSTVQYGDGLRGMIVVECDEYSSLVNRVVQALEGPPVENGLLSLPPKATQVEEGIIHEEILTLSDWYHDWNLDVEREKVMSPDGNPDPRIDGSLINGSEEDQMQVSVEKAAKAAVIRVVNSGMSGTQVVHVEGGKMVVVETDGVLVKPYTVETLSLAVGQRYTVVVPTGGKWHPIKIINGCNKMMGYITKVFWLVQRNPVGELTFDGRISKLPGFYKGELYKELEPLHGHGMLHSTSGDEAMQRITLDYEYATDEATVQQHGTRMYTVNGKTMEEYMQSPIEIEGGTVVEIVINSIDHMRHPWHMHGHHFQLVSLGDARDGPLRVEDERGSDAKTRYEQDLRYWEETQRTPMTRDSINIAGGSFAVLRIRTDRPGYWLLHCHVEWHVAKGLGVVLKELPSQREEVPQQQTEPGTETDTKTSKIKVLGIYLFIMTLFDVALYFFIM